MGPAPTLLVEPGQRYGRWLVLELTRTEPTKALPYGRRAARCRCDCGTERILTLINLTRMSRSCGCWRREKVADDNRRLKPTQIATHGLSGHCLYQTWAMIVKRCENPASNVYRRYGARGIKVHQDWRDVRQFVAYVERELGPRPPGCSIDRIDNDGHYEPGNIRWATAKEQAANKSYRPTPGTHCRRGHTFTAANTIRRRNGSRTCRICLNAGRRVKYQERKVAMT